MRQIKTGAWEAVFVEKINDARASELRYLATRKYLDAGCVPMWQIDCILLRMGFHPAAYLLLLTF